MRKTGMPSRKKLGTYAGLTAFAVGLVGFVVFGWRFGSPNGTLPTALGMLAVVVAVALTVKNGLR